MINKRIVLKQLGNDTIELSLGQNNKLLRAEKS